MVSLFSKEARTCLATSSGQAAVLPAMKRGRFNMPSSAMSMSTKTASIPSNEEPLFRPNASTSVLPRYFLLASDDARSLGAPEHRAAGGANLELWRDDSPLG